MILISAVAAEPPPKPDEAIAAAVTVGRAQWLEAGGERFLALYTPALTATPLGAAIILPGLGLNPDWPDVVGPLRTGLPGYGWSTLSIELPTPAQDKAGKWQLDPYFTATRARLQAAVAFLEQQRITNVALIGQGLGAAAGTVDISGDDNPKIAAFAAISLGVPPEAAASRYQPGLVEQIRVPMLDIYAGRDLDEVTRSAAARLAAARRGGHDASREQNLEPLRHSAMARLPTTEQNGYIAYRQFRIAGTDHRFRGAEATLLRRIAGWLKNHAGIAVVTGGP